MWSFLRPKFQSKLFGKLFWLKFWSEKRPITLQNWSMHLHNVLAVCGARCIPHTLFRCCIQQAKRLKLVFPFVHILFLESVRFYPSHYQNKMPSDKNLEDRLDNCCESIRSRVCLMRSYATDGHVVDVTEVMNLAQNLTNVSVENYLSMCDNTIRIVSELKNLLKDEQRRR